MATLTGGLPITLSGQSASGHSASGQAPIASTVCVGKIVSHAELEDDRHNVLLVGIRRAKLLHEIDAGRPFRMAQVQVAEDVYPPAGSEQRPDLKKSLLRAFASVIPVSKSVQQNLHELMAGQMSLGPITDIIAYTLPFAAEQKLRLLSDPDVDSRASELLRLLKSGAVHFAKPDEGAEQGESESGMRFPPPFSLN
jgi:ATP-dependent Lon protease